MSCANNCGRVSNPGGEFDPSDCRLCWLEQDPGLLGEVYRSRPKSPATIAKPKKASPVRRKTPCIHLGPLVKRTSSCKGNCPHGCDLGHGPTRPGVECQSCPDYDADGPLPDGKKILITGGIGDAIALESHMPSAMRDTLGGIVYAAPAAAEIRELFGAMQYPLLTDHRMLSRDFVRYNLVEVERAHGPLPGVEDWSIATIFPQGRPFVGSSLLSRRVAAPTLPASPYVVVVPHSTWGKIAGRAFDEADWRVLFAFLDTRGLLAVVLCGEKVPLPDHPRLLDWQAKTSILDSVEILKAAQGYLGIDSWMSVLAAQHFPAGQLSIKMRNAHGLKWRHVYYAPHVEFGFVRRRLEAPSWT